MKNEYIGEYGEVAVYKELLKQNYEVYRATDKIQPGWDIVVINDEKIIRIQVKTTILENKSTNNSFVVKDGYDILILVILSFNDEELSKQDNFYIMTEAEINQLKGSRENLSTTESKNKQSVVKGEINEHRDKWNKIKEFKNGKNN
ncbi:MAG: hypothetical protein E6Q33_04350 [Neisseriales bacterium]|nr:MAG: hypothetical protein E6Q33_04350 [Neisseriales bacterium]